MRVNEVGIWMSGSAKPLSEALEKGIRSLEALSCNIAGNASPLNDFLEAEKVNQKLQRWYAGYAERYYRQHPPLLFRGEIEAMIQRILNGGDDGST